MGSYWISGILPFECHWVFFFLISHSLIFLAFLICFDWSLNLYILFFFLFFSINYLVWANLSLKVWMLRFMFLAVRFDFKSFLVCFSYLIHHYVVKFYTPCLCLWFYKIWSKFTVWFLGFFTCSLCSRQDSKNFFSSDLYSLFSMHWSFFGL
jgi:hypothetical protein